MLGDVEASIVPTGRDSARGPVPTMFRCTAYVQPYDRRLSLWFHGVYQPPGLERDCRILLPCVVVVFCFLFLIER